MITKASIRNFKGIAECNINDLGPINLFIGKNDVCKSSIVEAIHYTCKEFTGPHLHEIIGRRTNVFFDARELWYGYNIAEDTILVTLVFDNDTTAALSIEALHPTTPVVGELEIECRGTAKVGTRKSISDTLSIYNAASWKTKEIFPNVGFLNSFPGDSGPKTKEYVTNCEFLDSSNRNDISSIEDLFTSIESQRKARVFNKYLRTIFEKESDARISRASQPGAPEKYRLAITRNKHKVFISGLGDGIRYGMQIIGTGLILKNTGLFIEEIESNQHPSSLKRLIDFLIEISIKNGLQLFVTTHNTLAWQYFAYHFRTAEERETALKCFHVTRDSTTGEVKCDQVDLRAPDQMKIYEALFGMST